MPYESLEILAGPVTLMGAALLKMWRDSSRTREIAEQTAKGLKDHAAECAQKNIGIARLEERVATIAAVQAEVKGTISAIDGKIDRILEARHR